MPDPKVRDLLLARVDELVANMTRELDGPHSDRAASPGAGPSGTPWVYPGLRPVDRYAGRQRMGSRGEGTGRPGHYFSLARVV
jgi:hypothetical protein